MTLFTPSAKPDVEIYPKAKSDRRLAPNIPGRGASRRGGHQRYEASLQVSVFDPTEELAPVRCQSEDLSSSGMLLHWPADEPLPEINSRLVLRFHTPADALEALVAARNIARQLLYVEKRALYGTFVLHRLYPAGSGPAGGCAHHGDYSHRAWAVSIQISCGHSGYQHAHERIVSLVQAQQPLALWYCVLRVLSRGAALAVTLCSAHLLEVGVGYAQNLCRCGGRRKTAL